MSSTGIFGQTQSGCKLIAFGPRMFARGFDTFDLLLNILVTVQTYLSVGSMQSIRAARVIRVTRVLRLARYAPTLRIALAVVQQSLALIASSVLLLFVALLMFITLGMYLFKDFYDSLLARRSSSATACTSAASSLRH